MLRLPEALRKTLAAEAESANRSLNSEILWRLGHTLSHEWQEFITGQEQAERERTKVLDAIVANPEFRKQLVAGLEQSPVFQKWVEAQAEKKPGPKLPRRKV
jgi:hypothetical protein